MAKSTSHVHTIYDLLFEQHDEAPYKVCCWTFTLQSFQIALLYDTIQFTLSYITQQGLTYFIDTQLYQTINMYEMFIRVQIFLCSEMT